MIQGQASFVLILNCEVCQEGNRDRAQGNEFDSRLVTFSVMSGKPLTSLSIHFPNHKVVRMIIPSLPICWCCFSVKLNGPTLVSRYDSHLTKVTFWLLI